MASTHPTSTSTDPSGQLALPLANAAPSDPHVDAADQLALPFRGWGTWHLDRRTRRSGLEHVHELRALLHGGTDDDPAVAA